MSHTYFKKGDLDVTDNVLATLNRIYNVQWMEECRPGLPAYMKLSPLCITTQGVDLPEKKYVILSKKNAEYLVTPTKVIYLGRDGKAEDR